MTTQHNPRRDYLISVTTKDSATRIQIRNAMHRLGAREIWNGFYWVALTEEERRRLSRRFGANGAARIKAG